MPKLFPVRKPRLRVSKRGKVSIAPLGFSIGGRRANINVSRRGLSYSIGGKHLRYNSRRGASCGCLVLLALGATGAAIGTVGMAVAAILT